MKADYSLSPSSGSSETCLGFLMMGTAEDGDVSFLSFSRLVDVLRVEAVTA